MDVAYVLNCTVFGRRLKMKINRCPQCGRDHFADVGKMVVSHAKKP